MTPLEIHEKINQLNLTIEQVLAPNIFILNNTVLEAQKEIDQLQQLCPHSYVDGYCEYCYKRKPEEYE